MMNAVLKQWHPMIGVDFHICNLPPPAPPVPMTPYKTGFILWGVTQGMVTQSYFLDHPSSGWGLTMSRGTDIGPMIPHIGPPSITLAIEWLFSSSKSHFGVSAYSGVDNKRAQNCIAVALAVHANPNLNCGTPVPTPTGVVIALNTHYVGMTWGDFFSGLFSMALDAALQFVMNKIGSGLGKLPGYIASRLAPKVFASNGAAFRAMWAVSKGVPGMSRAARREAAKKAAAALRESQIIRRALWDSTWGPTLGRLGAATSSPVGEAVIGFFLGSPTGADASNIPGGQSAYGAGSNAVDEYLNGPGPENLQPTAPPPIQ